MKGINMIAAIGLLYLDEETTFWYLKQFNPYTIQWNLMSEIVLYTKATFGTPESVLIREVS